jgi:hypothetical protein
MKKLFFLLIMSFAFIGTASADNQPAIIFSQDVVAIDAAGNLLPSVTIDPRGMAEMRTYDFDLGHQRLLRIETNLQNAKARGLNDVVDVVRRCFSYIETATGLTLKHGVLIYLIELEKIPYAYSFRASYNDASQWSEVRLALIEQGASLSGTEVMASLNDFLYDTLPHELGHDALETIPQLMHDIGINASHHTRWFIEGTCEVLAKGFSHQEAPALYREFLSLRNVDTVFADKQMENDMLTWAQNNNNGVSLESDLYGASMLTMMIWTETIPLKELLGQLGDLTTPVNGPDLVAMMQKTTGLDSHQIVKRAHTYGRSLKEKALFAKLY